jgi:hypothetical protein
MKANEIYSCLRHWYKRQNSGQVPFVWKDVVPVDRRVGPGQVKMESKNIEITSNQQPQAERIL